jgi:hypothetical protein
MLIHPALIPILKLIYPIQEPDRRRDRPLEVIAVGLSRSGTDSLRIALKQLGYNECHHASVFIQQDVGQGPQWCRLAWRKYHTNDSLSAEGRGLNASEFDKCIGNCMATTDMPCSTFACELIEAYPEAKVIVNKREDVEAWYQSVIKSFDNPKEPSPFGQWRTALFDPELFWMKAGRDAMWGHMTMYDFAQTGKDVYERHYQAIDKILEAERAAGKARKVLRWQVGDGWDPLLNFLGKEKPKDENGVDMAFPKGNAADEYQKKREAATADIVVRAKWRRLLVLVAFGGIIASYLASSSLYTSRY